jgi:hypothetical protein
MFLDVSVTPIEAICIARKSNQIKMDFLLFNWESIAYTNRLILAIFLLYHLIWLLQENNKIAACYC